MSNRCPVSPTLATGRAVEIDFVERIRDEHKFESFDALRQQIQRDVLAARKILGLPPEEQSGTA